MTPLIKKALFRIKKLQRPPIFGGKGKAIFYKQLRRGAAAGAMLLFVAGVVYYGKLPLRARLNEGDVATEDIYAPFSFSYETGVNEEKTKAAQKTASDKALDIYSIDTALSKKAKADSEKFFLQFVSIKKSGLKAADADLQKLNTLLPVPLSLDDINILLTYPDPGLLKDKTINILEKVSTRPIISDEDRQNLLDAKKEEIQIYQKALDRKTTNKIKELFSLPDSYKIVGSLLSELETAQKGVRNILYNLITNWIKPNLVFNQEGSESAKRQAASLIAPVYNILERIKGEIIIRKGQRVTKDHIIQLTKIGTSYTSKDIFSQFWGIVLLISILTFLLFGYLKHFEPKIFIQDKLLLLIGISILFAAILARIIVSSPLPSYFIPVATVSMLLAILVNGNVAAIASLAAAIIAALIGGAKFNIFLVSIVGGITAICTVHRARRHGQIIKSGVYVGFLNFITICTIGILSSLQIGVFLKEGLWGFGGGIASAAITVIFLPFFESAFKITTDIRLLELADLNHPLLKRMVTEAPGTYHHSIVVGNLSEAACGAIGANSLLARVGSYYHDIGKTEKAEYFAENQRDFLDAHRKLSPSMSALIITSHVKEGVELAEKYKLANSIKDIIEQHHGAGLVTYFYHQALEKKVQQEKEVSEEGFRYPGPKPQTKESAVVMLADSVEAASRTLPSPTPQRLKELVRKIINNKFIDRQMDECDLTLEEINKIADSFVKILTGIYHSRIEYPTKTKESYGDTNSKRTKNGQA